MKKKSKRLSGKIICLDPGIRTCGLVEFIDGNITGAANFCPEDAMRYILQEANDGPLLVIYEDIQYFSVRLGQHVIDTAKLIGKFEYRMTEAGIKYDSVKRWQVKKWVYDTYLDIAQPRIEKKIESGRITKENGEFVKSKFVFVDDRIVCAAMRKHWKIPTPKPGQESMYGLSKHSWQALAIFSTWVSICEKPRSLPS
jgi:hypothetical protein